MIVTQQGHTLFTLEMVNAIRAALERLSDERHCILEVRADLYGRIYICMSLSESKTQPASSTDIRVDAGEWKKNHIIKVDFHKVQEQGIGGGFAIPGLNNTEEALVLLVRKISKFVQ
jgi:hypothetical protein